MDLAATMCRHRFFQKSYLKTAKLKEEFVFLPWAEGFKFRLFRGPLALISFAWTKDYFEIE